MRLLPPIELITYAAEHLGHLCEQVTFLGGAVVTLLVTDQGARPPRATKDVDVTIELTSRLGFYDLEKALRARGFQNAMEGPICRFKHGLIVLDVMPTDPAILGFSNRWYPAAIRSAQRHTLQNGITINLITPACFLATKMEAFDSPTREDHGDMFVSRDFEDVVTLIDGRRTIAQDVLAAEADVRDYLQERLARQMETRNWNEGVEAHLEDGRANVVIERIEALIQPPGKDPSTAESEQFWTEWASEIDPKFAITGLNAHDFVYATLGESCPTQLGPLREDVREILSEGRPGELSAEQEEYLNIRHDREVEEHNSYFNAVAQERLESRRKT